MKKRIAAAMLCALLLLSTPSAALAADGDAGFYDLGATDQAALTPLTASGEAAEAVPRDVDGEEGSETFYPGASALRVTLSGTEQGALYLLTVSSGEDILYADQREGGGELRFTVSFPLPGEQTDYLLEIGSSAAGFQKIVIPFRYTPNAFSAPQPEPEPEPQPEPLPDVIFSDVDADAWYFEGVRWAAGNGVMNGVGDGRFDPNSVTSRAMLVTMLWRMEGEPATEYDMSFTDVPEVAWYTEAVRWAAAKGIVGGYSADSFGPNDSVSREQLAVILWRYAWFKGLDAKPEYKVNLGVFIDAERISDWARDGVQWAVDIGLLTGVGNEKLSPETNAGRAQVATVLMRYCSTNETT